MQGLARTMPMDVVASRALGENLYRVTIAANEKARQPPELDFDGLSFENYLKNPVVMWAHDVAGRSPSGGLPIGRTLRLHRTPTGEIEAEFEFLEDDPFARRVKNAWDRGFVQAASISWIPLESRPVEGGGWRDTRSELLEWSIVAVPADPDALREAHRRMVEEFLRPGQEQRMLGPFDYEDLVEALALLRDVVEGVQARSGHSANQEASRGLAEVRQLVEEAKAALIAGRPGA